MLKDYFLILKEVLWGKKKAFFSEKQVVLEYKNTCFEVKKHLFYNSKSIHSDKIYKNRYILSGFLYVDFLFCDFFCQDY